MLKIITSPDPLLNQVCEPCDPNDKSLKKLAKQMERAMYATDGVGIAAPQVGVLKRLIVIDVSPDDVRDPLVLVNPEILELDGELVTEEEGCLSCPGVSVPIERREWARVRYFDLKGEEWEIEGDGLLGRCLQHEIDHLNGITLFESAKPLDRIKALKQYEEAKRLGAKPGEVSLNAAPKVR
ncbi:MAG: peptide deformylase [Coriobacteriaceae bacterium]|jgi:peptide deformylase|nr:peptide deformylase [Coriobacteriaceae bacterium]